MAGLKSWSTTPANNATVGSISWAEGQAPSTVNDSARQTMADIRSWYETTEWRDFGDTPTRTGNTTFTVSGDQTLTYTANRRIKCTDSSTLYGSIASSLYSAPNTTVTVTLDSGNLSASLSAVAVGPDPTTQSIDYRAIKNGVSTAADNLWTGANSFGAVNYVSTSGTDTYTASLSPAITAYTTGAEYKVKFTNANTSTTPTLNLNSLGAKTIVRWDGSALLAGEIIANGHYTVRYDGTNMALISSPWFAYATASGTDTYTATLSPVPAAYQTGAEYRIKFTNANTSTTPTLNLNSLGAKTIVSQTGGALVAGQIAATSQQTLRYDGTNMVLITGSSSAAQGSSLPLLCPAKTASASSSITFTNSDFSWTDYDEYEFSGVGIVNGTNNQYIKADISTDGSTWDSTASNYSYAFTLVASNSASPSVVVNEAGAARIALTDTGTGMTNNAPNACNFTIKMFQPSNTSNWKEFIIESTWVNNAGVSRTFRMTGSASYNSSSAILGIRFLPSGGTFSGVFYARAKKKS